MNNYIAIVIDSVIGMYTLQNAINSDEIPDDELGEALKDPGHLELMDEQCKKCLESYPETARSEVANYLVQIKHLYITERDTCLAQLSDRLTPYLSHCVDFH